MRMNAKYYILSGIILITAVCFFLLAKWIYDKPPKISTVTKTDTLIIEKTTPAITYASKPKLVPYEVRIYEPDSSKQHLLDSIRNANREAMHGSDEISYRWIDTLINGVKVSIQTWFARYEQKFYDDIQVTSTDTTRTETTNINTGHGFFVDALFVALGIAAGTVFSIFFLR